MKFLVSIFKYILLLFKVKRINERRDFLEEYIKELDAKNYMLIKKINVLKYNIYSQKMRIELLTNKLGAKNVVESDDKNTSRKRITRTI